MRKFFIILFFLPIVFAVPAGTDYTIYTVPKCVGSITVTVEAIKIIGVDEYNLKSCTKNNETQWTCSCNNPFDIILNTKINTINTYDFTISYQVEEAISTYSNHNGGTNLPNNSNTEIKAPTGAPTANEQRQADTQRKVEINNVPVTNAPEKKSNISNPDISFSNIAVLIMLFILVIGIVVGGGGYLIYKYIWQTEDIGDTRERRTPAKKIDKIIENIDKPKEISDSQIDKLIGISKSEKIKDDKIDDFIRHNIR